MADWTIEGGREEYVREEIQFAMVLVDIVVVECNYGGSMADIYLGVKGGWGIVS